MSTNHTNIQWFTNYVLGEPKSDGLKQIAKLTIGRRVRLAVLGRPRDRGGEGAAGIG